VNVIAPISNRRPIGGLVERARTRASQPVFTVVTIVVADQRDGLFRVWTEILPGDSGGSV
jgi:hypothetical protein